MHDKINEILFRALRVGGMPSKLEVQGLCQDDAKRPDEVTIFAWSEGKNVAWEVTCADTVCQSHIAGTFREAGKAAEEAKTAKLNTYNELTRDFDVIPVAMETFGSWGQLGIKFIRQIGDRMATKTGDKQSRYHLLQQISIGSAKMQHCFNYGHPTRPKTMGQDIPYVINQLFFIYHCDKTNSAIST